MDDRSNSPELAQASILDIARVFSTVLVPTIGKGVIRRRAAV